jgi:hypothetical protein
VRSQRPKQPNSQLLGYETDAEREAKRKENQILLIQQKAQYRMGESLFKISDQYGLPRAISHDPINTIIAAIRRDNGYQPIDPIDLSQFQLKLR